MEATLGIPYSRDSNDASVAGGSEQGKWSYFGLERYYEARHYRPEFLSRANRMRKLTLGELEKTVGRTGFMLSINIH